MRFKALILVLATVLCLPFICNAQVGPSLYTPLAPCRLYDSRDGAGVPFVSGETRYLVVRGFCNVPEQANAVVASILVLNAVTPGAVRLWESSLPLPIPVSGLFAPGNSSHDETPRLCYPFSECASDLALRIDGSSAHAVVDVVGFYEPAFE